MSQDPIVIVEALRTPLGAFQGELKRLSAPELGASAIRGILSLSEIDREHIDEVLMGCVLTAGVGQAPARQAALAAGLGYHVGATTISKVCGSGMKAVMIAHDQIMAGTSSIVVAGGMESMSQAPYLVKKAREGYRFGHGELIDHMLLDGLEDAYEKGKVMGMFAEETSQSYGFSREDQDAYALKSLEKAQKAIQENWFEREIIPLDIKMPKNDIAVEKDELPRRAKPEKICDLKPAFKPNGTITAASSSAVADGAAALLIMRESEAKKRGLTPRARICAHASYAQMPHYFTTAPIGAIRRVVERAGWELSEVDLFEINEAFANVPMAAIKDLRIPEEKVNVHGGACALGHPLGASGARILVTLLAALEKYGFKKGVASLCIGGGEATAMAIECL
jgi:acetyl-CoA C-acetyltransferase